MLIPYQQIIQKYNLQIKTILHVGAHLAEERDDYFNNGCSKVVWIEANPDLITKLKTSLNAQQNIVLNYAVSDVDDQDISFKITNNGQSSSILDLAEHAHIYPTIFVEKEVKLKTKTLKTLFSENNLDMQEIDMINLDIQGAELLALKGAGDGLSTMKAIYTEINIKELYKDCALIYELDEYLSKYDFVRVETCLDNSGTWGDALYIKGECNVK